MLSQEAILAARKAGIDPRTLGFPMPEDIAKERRTAQLEEKRSARSLRDRLTVMNADFAHRRKLARDKQEARVNEEALKPKDMTYDETITAMNAIRAGDVPPPELAGRKPFPGMEKVWSDSMELRDKEGDNAILRNAIKVTKDQSGNSLFDIDLSELLNLKQMKFEEAAKVLTTFLDTPEQMVRARFGLQFVQADLQKLQAQAAEALYWITPDPTLGIKGVDEDGQPVYNTPLDKRLENSTKIADANLALGKSGMSLRLGTLIGNLPAGTPLPALPGISNPGVPPGSLRKPAPINKPAPEEQAHRATAGDLLKAPQLYVGSLSSLVRQDLNRIKSGAIPKNAKTLEFASEYLQCATTVISEYPSLQDKYKAELREYNAAPSYKRGSLTPPVKPATLQQLLERARVLAAKRAGVTLKEMGYKDARTP